MAPPVMSTFTHLRRRSSVAELTSLCSPISPTGSQFSDVTAYEDEEEPAYPTTFEKKGDYSAVQIDDDPESRGWRVASTADKTPRRRVSTLLWTGSLLVATAMGGWLAGSAGRRETIHASGAPASHLPKSATEKCNPYEQHGVLLVNTSVPNLNMWQPIGAPESCEPVDYTTQLLEMQVGLTTTNPTLDSLRNRTVLIFGDSVDRDHNQHFCSFVGGYHEMIGSNHELAPPYPEGHELPSDDYKDYIRGEQVWPDNPQSRPWICHVFRLNIRFVNVFHYGFRDYTKWMSMHPHYYPPASIEDRFDQIVVPLLDNIANKYGGSPVPDIVSIAPGFWGLLRLSFEEMRHRDASIMAGNQTIQQSYEAHNPWNNMKAEQRDFMEGRIESVLHHLGNGWRGSAKKAPLILWRSLHHIQEHDYIPFTRLQALDQIGRSVVERLVAESEAALDGAQEWKAWLVRLATSHFGKIWKKESVEEAKAEGLSGRLRIDEWGALMLGQEKHFLDKVHPLPLPGSYLWSNMILQQLKSYTEGDEL